MKKIVLLFSLAMFVASFAACSAPAEVKTPEQGKAALIGAKATKNEDDGSSRAMVLD